jgi:hypothetical protein
VPGLPVSLEQIVDFISIAVVAEGKQSPTISFGGLEESSPHLEPGWLYTQGWRSTITSIDFIREIRQWLRVNRP